MPCGVGGGRAGPRGEVGQEQTVSVERTDAASARFPGRIVGGAGRSVGDGARSRTCRTRWTRNRGLCGNSARLLVACPLALSPNPCLRHQSFSLSPTSLRWRPCLCPDAELPVPFSWQACSSVRLCETTSSPALDR